MPLYSLCCGSPVPTREPKLCGSCGRRVFKTTIKPPPPAEEGSALRPVWSGTAWGTAPVRADSNYGRGGSQSPSPQRGATPSPPPVPIPPTKRSPSPKPKPKPKPKRVPRPGEEGPLLAAVAALDSLSQSLQQKLERQADSDATAGAGDDAAAAADAADDASDAAAEHTASEAEAAAAAAASPRPGEPAWWAASCDEVEVVGYQPEPQYNGCRGWVLEKGPGDSSLVRLGSGGAGGGHGGAPWRGSLGARGGSAPRHERLLPWEQGDRQITRMKDVYNRQQHQPVYPQTSSLASSTTSPSAPGSLEIERRFHNSYLRLVKAAGTATPTPRAASTGAAASAAAASPGGAPRQCATGTLRSPTGTVGRQPWYGHRRRVFQ